MEKIAHLIPYMRNDLVIVTAWGDVVPAAINCDFNPNYYLYWVAIKEVDAETALKDLRIIRRGRNRTRGFMNVECHAGVLFPFDDIVIGKTKRIKFKL